MTKKLWAEFFCLSGSPGLDSESRGLVDSQQPHPFLKGRDSLEPVSRTDTLNRSAAQDAQASTWQRVPKALSACLTFVLCKPHWNIYKCPRATTKGISPKLLLSVSIVCALPKCFLFDSCLGTVVFFSDLGIVPFPLRTKNNHNNETRLMTCCDYCLVKVSSPSLPAGFPVGSLGVWGVHLTHSSSSLRS